MSTNYLPSVIKQFKYYKQLGDQTFNQIEENHLFQKFGSESNSIGIIVNHIWGNMMSRWTNFMHEDGEKQWRNRDREFEEVIQNKEDLLSKWEEAWDCLFKALSNVDERNLANVIYIRNMGHTVTEAINRQLAHYAYHIGQIVFIGIMIKGSDWESLSIPRGKSKEYNREKFSKEKHEEHFTTEFLKDHKEKNT